MTKRLYYDNPMNSTMTATIMNISSDRRMIELDQTVFYPEGGGQPGDRGTIGGMDVVNTTSNDQGTILHHLALPLPEPGSTDASRQNPLVPGVSVTGTIDWSHRYDYMQQHTGQHVLSGALYRILNAATVSVHQGTDVVTIEVDRPSFSREELHSLETEACRIIAEDLPVRAFEVDQDELTAYTLRRPTSRTGTIRLVEIEGYDLVACGGVHLPRTGLLNLVKVVGTETIRGRMRIAFKIGARAIEDYRVKHEAITAAGELFSSGVQQVPERIKAMQTELQLMNRAVRLRAERIADLTLRTSPVPSEEDSAPSPHPASIVLDDEDEDVFKALAERATEDPTRLLVLLNKKRDCVQWAIVVGKEYEFPGEALREQVLAPAGAKGGGKPPLWRGIIPNGPNPTDTANDGRPKNSAGKENSTGKENGAREEVISREKMISQEVDGEEKLKRFLSAFLGLW